MCRRRPYLAAGSCLLLVATVIGCSQQCTAVAAIGRYTMTANGHAYELRLATGGLGTLSRDAKTENIKWEWENEQVFLDLAGDLAENLAVLSVPRSQRDAAAKSQRVSLGLVPKCQSGSTTEFDLSLEELAPHFARNE
jgi:hypothetical protein